jgi:hypothetical protein
MVTDLFGGLLSLLAAIIGYVATLWRVVLTALTLQPDLLQAVEAYPRSRWYIVGVVFVAGVSTLFGQSVALFVNRVTPRRFVASLLLNGLMYVVSWSVWAGAIWLVERMFITSAVPFGTVARIVGLAAAPFVFGFFILTPYFGTFWGRVLNVWSLLITLGAVRYTFQLPFWSALLCVGVGWLLMWVSSATIGRPVLTAQHWLRRRVAGTAADADATEMIVAFPKDGPVDRTNGDRRI